MSNLPLEIEYKFLITYPDTEVLKAQPNYRKEKLCQLYLSLPDKYDSESKNCRIRRIERDGNVRYIKTFKTSLTPMTRIEVESEISEEEFTELSAYIKSGKKPIEKIRHSFELNGFTYEVDVFPFWNDRAFLEVEVSSEDIIPPIPDFIQVLKDVTDDPRYRNNALASKIITEDIG